MRIFAALLASAILFSTPLLADCQYPDSSRGSAPAWLCGDLNSEEAVFLAVGDKSRMPSISLQNRLAGKTAMTGVVARILEHAAAALQQELLLSDPLLLPSTSDWGRVARFKGIAVLDKVVSPRRHLYVLAGVREADIPAMELQARRELLRHNKDLVIEHAGKAKWRELLQLGN
ncbi:MAG: hypothetical protein ACSHWQ_04770 [Spongiibacteraceae bacterium]